MCDMASKRASGAGGCGWSVDDGNAVHRRHRREVRELLVAGKTDAEVRAFMQQRYGDFILFRPALTARTAWLWAAPVVLLAIGLFVAFRVIRKRASVVDEDDVVPGEEGASR